MKKEYSLLIAAGILYGTIAPGAEILLEDGLSLLEVAFYRAFFITLLILPVFIARPRYMFPLSMAPFFIIYGLIGGLLETAMFASLYLDVPVALVVFFLYTQPVWTILMGKFFLGERIYRKHIVSVVLGLIGIFILVRSWDVESARSFAGIIIALIAGLLLSLWVIWGRKSAMYKNHYITTTFGWSFFASVWLVVLFIVITLIYPEYSEVLSLSPGLISTKLPELLLFAIIAGVLPHFLFYKGIEYVSASSAGIVLLLEPVSATVIAAVLFSEHIGISFIIGGLFILMSNYLVLKSN